MEGMEPSEIGVLGAVTVFIIKVLADLIKSMIPKTRLLTEADVKEMEHKTNLKNLVSDMKAILIRLSDKDDARDKTLDDIHSIVQRDHRNLGEVRDHMGTLTTKIASGDFCKLVNGRTK